MNPITVLSRFVSQENYPVNRIIRLLGYLRALNKRLSKSLYTDRWGQLLGILKQVRKEQGMTQVELAKILHRPQSLIAKIESGERKLDVCQFLDYVEAIGGNPTAIIQELIGSSATQ